MADDEMNPPKMASAILRRLAKELDEGTLALVAFTWSDKSTVRFSCQLALPVDELARVAAAARTPPPDPRRCPVCHADKPQECGRVPESDPPVLDLMCGKCQHVWQITEG